MNVGAPVWALLSVQALYISVFWPECEGNGQTNGGIGLNDGVGINVPSSAKGGRERERERERAKEFAIFGKHFS